MVKSKIDTLFFDAAGTLISLTEPVGKSYAKIARKHGLAVEPDALTRAFKIIWAGLTPREAGAGFRAEDDRGWWRSLALAVIEEASPNQKGFDAESWFNELYAYFAEPGVWEVFPDVIPALKRLRPKYRMAVLSNYDRRLYRVMEDLGLLDYFDAVIISSEVGAEKPHPKIFAAALEKLKADPRQCMHVGDDPVRDIEGAENSGLSAFPLKRPETTLNDLLKALSSAP